jgi:hypothetical protein
MLSGVKVGISHRRNVIGWRLPNPTVKTINKKVILRLFAGLFLGIFISRTIFCSGGMALS